MNLRMRVCAYVCRFASFDAPPTRRLATIDGDTKLANTRCSSNSSDTVVNKISDKLVSVYFLVKSYCSNWLDSVFHNISPAARRALFALLSALISSLLAMYTHLCVSCECDDINYFIFLSAHKISQFTYETL